VSDAGVLLLSERNRTLPIRLVVLKKLNQRGEQALEAARTELAREAAVKVEMVVEAESFAASLAVSRAETAARVDEIASLGAHIEQVRHP
jgi:phage shock protein A